MNKIKITISLIHNNNKDRNEYIIPQINTLKYVLTKEFGDVSFINNQYHSEKKIYFFMNIIKNLMIYILYYKWNNYLELNILHKTKNYLIRFTQSNIFYYCASTIDLRPTHNPLRWHSWLEIETSPDQI